MQRHYDRAPISEAVIDLRVEWPESAPADVFDRLASALHSQFPVQGPIQTFEMGFHTQVGIQEGAHEGTQDGQFRFAQEVIGLRLQSESGSRVLQLTRGGFTYSHLPPYSNWGSFRGEALALWQTFVEIVGLVSVTRTAVRVINKITLPVEPAELAAYSNLHAQFPASLPDGINVMAVQLQAPLDGWVPEGLSTITAAIGRVALGQSELTLDFDLFVSAASAPQDPGIWRTLDELSQAKNRVFESCITDRLREMIS